MSAPSSWTQIETQAADQKLLKLEEKREMSAPVIRSQNKLQVVYQVISKAKERIEMQSIITKAKTPAKILGGFALGALLLIATPLPFGTAYADGPSRPLVTEETLIGLGADNLAGDAWMQDSPFYQDFSEVSRIEVGATALEAQGPPIDAWMQDSPFYQDFSAVGGIEVGSTALETEGPPLDAWMHDSPFYQDFSDVVG